MIFNLFPPPKKIRTASANLDLTNRKYIRLLQPGSEYLTDAIRRFSNNTTTSSSLTFGDPEPSQVLLSIDPTSGPSVAESYELRSNQDGFLLCAKSESGIYYGLVTLKQILEQVHTSVPYFVIQDVPDFEHRGVMLDISRCKVPSMKTLRQLIDQFSRMKINQLQLYTEHTFEFVNHPLIWADSSPMTAKEILELKDYCNARFIELVPNLNSFGHFERWLRFPEYHHHAECPEGFIHPFSNQRTECGSTLKPNRQSLNLLRELYDEYLPLFDSTYFNVGGDEPWELGWGWSRKKCDKLGTTNVYIDFMAKVKKLVDSRGRQMMFWSDIVLKQPGSLKRLSRDLVALNWGYEGNHPFNRECEQMAVQKIPFYVCPGTSSWNSIIGRLSNATKNLANAARNGLNFGADGYLITDWGDHGHHQYLPFSYPGFLIGACQSWNYSGSRKLDIEDGLNSIFFRDATGITSSLLVELGRVLELAPSKIRNATIFNRLLFWDMEQEPAVTQPIPDRQLKQCESALADFRSRVKLIQPGLDGQLLRGELSNAIDMATHGIHRLQAFRGARISHKQLRRNLTGIISSHENLWLARNRPGGLQESAAHLYSSLENL
ncbi:MAG: family 20 glycosylhydrolase [Gammaproteobacteria bacterium]|nr:family 20 glycosylhydrolase [Gammaproteobacteria bacterium]